MKQSLETKLYNIIKQEGYLSYDQLVYLCNKWNNKIETGARKMRLIMETGKVKKIEKGKSIIGYQWVTNGDSSTVEQRAYKPLVDGSNPRTICCTSYKIFQEHARDCETLQPVNVLF